MHIYSYIDGTIFIPLFYILPYLINILIDLNKDYLIKILKILIDVFI